MVTTASNVYNDIVGNDRIYGTAMDLGAYEYQGMLTGMLSNLNASDLKLYPNPVSGTKLSISESVQWRVFTLQGRALNQGNGTEIDVSNLVEGSYLIEVTIDGQRTTKTFVKK